MSLEDIFYNLNKVLKIDLDNFIEYIKELMIEKLIVKDDEKFYHHSFFDAERNIANQLIPFIKRKINKKSLQNSFDEMIEAIEYDEGIKYSDEQKKAIFEACSNGLYIIMHPPLQRRQWTHVQTADHPAALSLRLCGGPVYQSGEQDREDQGAVLRGTQPVRRRLA